MNQLPEILDQGALNGCSSFAIAGVCNFQLAKTGKDRIDAAKLYAEETGSGGNTIGAILMKAELNGLPLVAGGRVKIKSYTRIIPGALNLINEIKKGLPLAFTMQISDGRHFADAVQPPDYVLEWPLDTHSMVICDYDPVKQAFYCANSWGPKWGYGGYFWIQAFRMEIPYCVETYSIVLDI